MYYGINNETDAIDAALAKQNNDSNLVVQYEKVYDHYQEWLDDQKHHHHRQRHTLLHAAHGNVAHVAPAGFDRVHGAARTGMQGRNDHGLPGYEGNRFSDQGKGASGLSEPDAGSGTGSSGTSGSGNGHSGHSKGHGHSVRGNRHGRGRNGPSGRTGGHGGGGGLAGPGTLGKPPFLPAVPAGTSASGSGSSALPLILILSVIGLGGWFLWHKFHQTAHDEKKLDQEESK